MKFSIALAAALLTPTLAGAASLPKDLSQNDLVDYLKNGGSEQRAEACKRLGQRRAMEAVTQIGELVEKDESHRTRKVCVEALKEIGAGDVYLRNAVLKDQEKDVRLAALDALEHLDIKDMSDLAAKLLAEDQDREVRKRTCWLIEKKHWASAVPAVGRLVAGEGPLELRKTCVKALVAAETEEAYAVLHKVLTDDPAPEMRREVSSVLEDHPRKSSLQPLCKALYDKEERIVRNAIDGLQKLGLRDGAACLQEAAKSAKSDRLAGRMNEVANKLR